MIYVLNNVEYMQFTFAVKINSIFCFITGFEYHAADGERRPKYHGCFLLFSAPSAVTGIICYFPFHLTCCLEQMNE